MNIKKTPELTQKMLNRHVENGGPDFDPEPLSLEQIKNLKFGNVCYIASQAGVEMAMVIGYTEKKSDLWQTNEATITFATTGYSRTYKLKNANKSYELYRAYADRWP